jgi:MFS family permease
VPWGLLGFAALDGTFVLYLVVLNVGLPLWVAADTEAPASIVGLLYVVNTALVVLLQIGASRLGKTLSRAARAELLAGVLLAVASVLLGLGGLVAGQAAAIALLAAGVVLLTLGEIMHSAASWSISYSLAGEGSRTQSLAVFGLGRNGALVVGPLIITAAVLGNGMVGWLGLAASFLLVGVVSFARVNGLTKHETAQCVPPAWGAKPIGADVTPPRRTGS